MGCPALDTMRLAMEARIAELGATPDVRVASTTRGRPTTSHRRDARSSARPVSRRRPRGPSGRSSSSQLQRGVPLPVLRIDEHEAREPLRARPRAGRSATARTAASRSSSSRRSSQSLATHGVAGSRAATRVLTWPSRSSSARPEAGTTNGPRVSRPSSRRGSGSTRRSLRAGAASTTCSPTVGACSRSTSTDAFPRMARSPAC